MYNFYLQHSSFDRLQRIEDPVGWDSLGKAIRRDRTTHGITFEYTPRLRFIKRGKSILHYLYESEGIEAEVILIVRVYDSRLNKYVEDYRGRINFTAFRVSTLYAECNVENTGFLQKFINRAEINVDLLSGTSIDEKPITPAPAQTVSLHSKVIRRTFKTSFAPGAGRTVQNDLTIAVDPGIYYVPIPLPVELDEIATRYNYPLDLSQEDPTMVNKYMWLLDEEGTYNFDINFSIIFSTYDPGANNLRVKWVLKTGDNAPIETAWQEDPNGSVLGSYTLQAQDVDLKKGDPIYLYAVVDCTAMNGTFAFFLSITSQETFLVEGDTIVPATDAPVIFPHEAFSVVASSITGSDGAFYSDYLGRTSLGYAVNGAGAFRSITRGTAIRGLDIQEKSIFASFDKLRKAFQVTDAIGIAIDRDAEGKERVRLEPATYFYQAVLTARFTYVREIEKQVDTDSYYNEIEIGFRKWANEEINNLDEFLTKRQYVLPVTQLKKKLSLISEIIASGYTIEFTRRDRDSQTRDNELDDELFFIQLREDGQGGYETDRDQDFDQVTGILSPSTAYNLKLAISEMMLRHGRIIRSGLYQLTGSVKPSFSEGNDQLSLQKGPADPLLADNRPLTDELGSPLYVPEIYEFAAPVSYEQRLAIQQNPYGYIEFSESDTEFKKGWILEAQPDQKTRKTTFKLLKAPL